MLVQVRIHSGPDQVQSLLMLVGCLIGVVLALPFDLSQLLTLKKQHSIAPRARVLRDDFTIDSRIINTIESLYHQYN